MGYYDLGWSEIGILIAEDVFAMKINLKFKLL